MELNEIIYRNEWCGARPLPNNHFRFVNFYNGLLGHHTNIFNNIMIISLFYKIMKIPLFQ